MKAKQVQRVGKSFTANFMMKRLFNRQIQTATKSLT